MPSIGVACNFFNEANALPGFLESAALYADHIVMYETGPQGEHSSDGSIEIIEKFGAELRFGAIDDGYGVIRTRLITMPPTDWTIILDADERVHRYMPRLMCHGSDSYDVGKYYPEFHTVGLAVSRSVDLYDQIEALKRQMRPEVDVVVTSRRHWQDLTFNHPSQNWHTIADWQARIVRNCPHVQYRQTVKMHEQIVDTRTGQAPRWHQPSHESVEVFHDHYHLFWKRFEREQRNHDIAIYNALCEDKQPPTLMQFRGGLEPEGNVA